jgi:hypothetical protein
MRCMTPVNQAFRSLVGSILEIDRFRLDRTTLFLENETITKPFYLPLTQNMFWRNETITKPSPTFRGIKKTNSKTEPAKQKSR